MERLTRHEWFTVYVVNVKNGCNFVINPGFIAGLREYGYELKLVKIGSDEE